MALKTELNISVVLLFVARGECLGSAQALIILVRLPSPGKARLFFQLPECPPEHLKMSVESYKMKEVSATCMGPLRARYFIHFLKIRAKAQNSKGLVEKVLALIWCKQRHL